MEQERLLELLAKSLNYAGIVYRQSTYLDDQEELGCKFTLEFKHTDIPEDSLLFFVPSVNSDDSGQCKLAIRVPRVNQETGAITYGERVYDIVVESTDGRYHPAKKNELVANRMCVFRFDFRANRAILVNSPLYNEAAFDSLTATSAIFSNPPKIMDGSTIGNYVDVATKKDIASLASRIEALENRILFGVDEPEEALADKPTGTIYIQVQED